MIYADKTRILSGMHPQGVLFWMITSHPPEFSSPEIAELRNGTMVAYGG